MTIFNKAMYGVIIAGLILMNLSRVQAADVMSPAKAMSVIDGQSPPAPAAASIKYGNCKISGKFGEFKIKPARANTLTVLTSLPMPGSFNGETADTIVDGSSYCMAAEIAYRSGLSRVKVVDVSFASIIAGTNASYDIALAGTSITPFMKKIVTFSIPYLPADFGIVVKTGTKITNTATLRDARVGIIEGITSYNYTHDILNIKNLAVFSSTTEMIMALDEGKIDAAMGDIMVFLTMVRQSGGKFDMVGRYDTGGSYAAIYPEGSKNVAVIDEIMRQMVDDGTIRNLVSKYLSPEGVDKIPVFGRQGFEEVKVY